MPMTVITLTKVPPSLRGDLTKWMQEIATGVYVGNFNSAIREKLWQRVKDNLKSGEATLSYSCRNEIGYDFDIGHGNRERLDYDGVPLVFIKKEHSKSTECETKKGFSRAATFRKAKRFGGAGKVERSSHSSYVVLDLETDGLDETKNTIIEIGMIRIKDDERETFHALIKSESKLPEEIIKLTGISDELLNKEGIPLDKALDDGINFMGDDPIVGYNVGFDIGFMNRALTKAGKETLKNKAIDLKQLVKREKKFLRSYQLQTVIKNYNMDHTVPHRALEDAEIIAELATKVNEFLKIQKSNGLK